MQDAQSTTSNAERLYYSSISSPYTQRSYRTYLQKYLAFYGMKNVSELLTKDHKEVESQIIEFIIQLKEKGMKRAAIANYTCPILSFCKIMNIMLTEKQGIKTGIEVIGAKSVPKGIIDYAKDSGVDTIVIGTKGLTGVAKFLLGSVASAVIDHAHCPVFAIR